MLSWCDVINNGSHVLSERVEPVHVNTTMQVRICRVSASVYLHKYILQHYT